MEIKICLIGSAETGKTYFVDKLSGNCLGLNGKEYVPYNATIGCSINEYKLDAIKIQFVDTAGQEKFMGLRDGYYVGSDLAFIFLDKSTLSQKESVKFERDYKRVCDRNLCIYIFNGSDEDFNNVHFSFKKLIKKSELCQIDLSVATKSDIEMLIKYVFTKFDIVSKLNKKKQIHELREKKEKLIKKISQINNKLAELEDRF